MSGSLPLAGRAGEGVFVTVMYQDLHQRNFARELRNQLTEPEKRLWWFLRAGQLGCKFRRQAAIGPYIVDFICFSHGLIVEFDGPQHTEADAKAYDAPRTDWLVARVLPVVLIGKTFARCADFLGSS